MSIFLSLHTIWRTWLFSKYSLIFPYIVCFILNLTNLIWVSQKKKVVFCFCFFFFNTFCQLYDYKMQYQEREIMKILDRSVQYWRVTCGYESFQDKKCMGGSLVYFLLNSILMEEVIQQVFGFGANKNHSGKLVNIGLGFISLQQAQVLGVFHSFLR